MVNLQIGIPDSQIRDITWITVCKNVFTVEECEELIISQAQNKNRPGILIDQEKQHFKYLEQNSINPSSIDKLKNIISKINSNSYGFYITEIDTAYFLENKINNYSDWYVDLGKDDFTTTRKLTVLTFLSDTKDYQGGGLSILVNHQNVFYEQGTVLIFPSFQFYKFEPIIKGNQHIFVSWACGPAFH